MNEKTKLLLAIQQLDNIVEITEDNEWKSYLYNYLSPVKYELERQIGNLIDS